jgi:glycerophosphoryl diester phosphodiesterase
VTSFNPESLAVVARTYPDVMTGLALQAPLTLEDGMAICGDAGHVALIPDHRLIGGELGVDIAVYAWTVNDETRARELVVLGVDGIITDDPKRMSEALGSVR